MIPRLLAAKLLKVSKKYPVITLTGPRQSGKTTLVKQLFPHKPYVSLENPDIREFAETDPRGFLNQYPNGAIFDEVQRTPHLFSYIQGIVDDKQKSGFFILTGSQNFLLLEKISQSLAGRAAILKLLPFSVEELHSKKHFIGSLDSILFKGMYPRLYDKHLNPKDWFPSYIQTYLERDVRQIKNIGNLSVFQKFLKLCAARTGQLLNLSSLANDCGITHNTAKAWISILEASFLIFLLPPYYKNFSKRLIKSPKLHFYDTGLVCSLLGIDSPKQLAAHPLRGNIFESFAVSELVKIRYNSGLPMNLYFWRDKTGNEIDCLAEKGRKISAIEIKSGETVTSDSLKGLEYLRKTAAGDVTDAYLIYAGHETQQREASTVLPWKQIKQIAPKLI